MYQRHIPIDILSRSYRVVDGPEPPAPSPAPTPQEAAELDRLRYEADAARAESSRIKKELDEIRRQLPSDDQRARWADLETQFQTAEEQRKRKEGQFDEWRAQINDKHAKELDAERQQTANMRAQAEATERELNDTLIGLAFSGATEWFGPTGKTVLPPAVAQSYFGPNVAVESLPSGNGGPPKRRVVVKDGHGTVIVDPKSGQPMPFAQAIGEIIEAYPDKRSIMRGAGRVGSGSAGGDGTLEGRDLSRLKQADFKDPAVRDAVRESLAASGGLQIGPAFDRLQREQRGRKA